MARAYIYNIYDQTGRLVLANAQRKDIADLTGLNVRTVEDKVRHRLSTVIKNYTVKCVLERSNEGPVNAQVKKILETGIWNEVCEPFRKLRK